MISLNPFKSPSIDFFDSAVAYAIRNEIGSDLNKNGGFSETIGDRGGATKWGINIFTLSLYRGQQCRSEDVKDLTRDEAEMIYRSLFWHSINCEKIRRPQIATAIFDMGVLFGVSTSAKRAQRACIRTGCTTLKDDGIIGPQSIAALNSVNVVQWMKEFQSLFQDRITDIVTADSSQVKFRNGWSSRVEKLRTLV